MKAVFKYMFLLMLAISLSSMAVHKYYVAVFQMEYVPQKKVVQMTSRVFVDDLEAAFTKKYAKKFNLGSSKELAESNAYIKKYFSENIDVKINGKSQPLTFLGKEMEGDVILCYYTLPADKSITSIEVKNTLLFEAFPAQQNIIHTNINKIRKSLMLTDGEPEGTLQF